MVAGAGIFFDPKWFNRLTTDINGYFYDDIDYDGSIDDEDDDDEVINDEGFDDINNEGEQVNVNEERRFNRMGQSAVINFDIFDNASFYLTINNKNYPIMPSTESGTGNMCIVLVDEDDHDNPHSEYGEGITLDETYNFIKYIKRLIRVGRLDKSAYMSGSILY